MDKIEVYNMMGQLVFTSNNKTIIDISAIGKVVFILLNLELLW